MSRLQRVNLFVLTNFISAIFKLFASTHYGGCIGNAACKHVLLLILYFLLAYNQSYAAHYPLPTNNFWDLLRIYFLRRPPPNVVQTRIGRSFLSLLRPIYRGSSDANASAKHTKARVFLPRQDNAPETDTNRKNSFLIHGTCIPISLYAVSEDSSHHAPFPCANPPRAVKHQNQTSCCKL